MSLPNKKSLIRRNERSGKVNAEEEITSGKEKVRSGEIRIGCSKQASIKVAEFQYNKVGFWMERIVPDNERDINANVLDMSEQIDDLIEKEINEFQSSKEKELRKKR